MFSFLAKATMLTRAYFLEHFPDRAVSLDAVAQNLLELDKTKLGYENLNKDVCVITYGELQLELSEINEHVETRKRRGVYYTPADVVGFIGSFVSKVLYNRPSNNILDSTLADDAIEDFCLRKTVLDPTCGVGEFLIGLLEIKLDL